MPAHRSCTRPSAPPLTSSTSPEVLDEFQHKWETKVIASRVAEFDSGHAQAAGAAHAHRPYPAPPAQYAAYAPHQHQPQQQPQQQQQQQQHRSPVKPEPFDARYALALRICPPASSRPVHDSAPMVPADRIPQTDGPSASSEDDDEPAYAPQSKHPSLPQPKPKDPEEEEVDNEAINSDLDDSDTENEEDPEDAAPETDIVFCTYDKVARVKNKWKCVLKDGMIHTNGKDYLFQRCTGEFEW
ncbi:transcription factor IIA, alpha/beta subunit-domain-containing protein [Mycena epipterygia]|nr:transcription factor IIA, alpha/beta subunit-domain-containing protein [Mycena epipterygia]